jgi:hypothetical protein
MSVLTGRHAAEMLVVLSGFYIHQNRAVLKVSKIPIFIEKNVEVYGFTV